MNRSRLQLVTIHLIDEKPPVKTFLNKLRDSFNSYFNQFTDNSIDEENGIHLANLNYKDTSLVNRKSKPENNIIAGLITENLFPGMRILEAGCGDGSLFQQIHKLPLHYYGFDSSVTNIKDARAKFNRLGNPVFLDRDFNEYSSSSKFDVIVIKNVLSTYHLSEIDSLLDKTVSMLKDRDSIIIISMTKNIAASLIWRRLKQLPEAYLNISVKDSFTGESITIKAFKDINII